MAELTLADLLAWEPRLRLALPLPSTLVEQELSWAVAARTTPPLLPALHGGEVVLLPHRILADAGLAVEPLLADLASHQVAGVVLEPPDVPATGSPVPVLVMGGQPPVPLDHALEGELNRLLTRQRGEIYRIGTDLGRSLTALTTGNARLSQVLLTAADALDLPAVVTDARGAIVAASHPDSAPPAPEERAQAGWVDAPMSSGATLWLGPVPPARRALARLAAERVVVAADAALARTAQLRPRGPARAAALADFLTTAGDASDAGAQAVMLGLDAEQPYRVVLASPALGVAPLARAIAALGTAHDAGRIDGALAAVIEVRPATTIRPRLDRPASGGGAGRRSGDVARTATWLALSGVASGVAALPEAARQARFVGALLAAGALPGPVVHFDDVDELGVFQVLYRLWESGSGRAALAAFAAAALGDLRVRDRRGELQRTLLAYLDAGGSHAEAAVQLGIHRNTLAYRLKQIATHTGHDPANPAHRLLLHLALHVTRLPPPLA